MHNCPSPPGSALIVDNTFATPVIMRPIETGANFVVHSLTKYLAGHGDVLGGIVIADEENLEALRAYSRIVGPVLGPFEAYLRCVASRLSRCAWSGSVRMRAGWRARWLPTPRWSGFTIPPTPSIRTPIRFDGCLRPAFTAQW